jgi:hypothetical protein
MKRCITAGLAVALVTLPTHAQERPDLDVLLDKLATYLERYAVHLTGVIADERFVQEERRRNTGATRTTDAEVLFLRSSEKDEWLGIRDVKKVNGKAVPGTGVSLADLLSKPDKDVAVKATAIIEASARHYLAGRRAINVPTIPLEALSPRNHPRFIFKLRGRARVAGVHTERLEFTEFDEPTLVQSTDGGSLWTRGLVWLEPESGAVWRAELIIGPDKPGAPRRIALESKVRVEFTNDPALGMMVPRELSEQFWIRGGVGYGKGKYDNFRKVTQGGQGDQGADFFLSVSSPLESPSLIDGTDDQFTEPQSSPSAIARRRCGASLEHRRDANRPRQHPTACM